MKKLTLLAVFCLSLLMVVQTAEAQNKRKKSWWSHRGDYDWGAGVRLGEPSGLTFRKYFPKTALDVVFGVPAFAWASKQGDYGFDPVVSLHLGIHYCYRGEVAHNNNLHFTLGVGGMVQNKYISRRKNVELSVPQSELFYGPSGQIGFDYHFPGTDISYFVDLNPTLEINESAGLYPMFYAGTGLRFLH